MTLIFALLLPVLVLLVGGTIDLLNVSQSKAQLQQASDAAALAAVARCSPGFEAANSMSLGGSVPDSITSASTNAFFSADWASRNDTTYPKLKGNACSAGTFVCRVGTNVYSYVSATATFTPAFLKMVGLVPGFAGIAAIPLTVTSSAMASTPTYVNYYILVDVSQSMGIAATAADMTNMYARVGQYGMATGGESGCVFGCHVPAFVNCCSGSTQTISGQPVSNETLAHSSKYGTPITLRIDSAVSAIQSTITQAQNLAGGFANIKIGLYEVNHGPSSSNYVTTVSAPSSNYSALSTAASTIDLGSNNAYGYGDTDFDDEISAFAATLTANGSGATALTPENYVFIITDGLSDNSGSSTNNHPTAAFNSSDCTALKANATVGVIYTTYTPIYNNNSASAGYEPNFASLVAPYLSTIPTNLQAGTSDSSQYNSEASDGPALIAKLQQLFAATQKVAHVAH